MQERILTFSLFTLGLVCGCSPKAVPSAANTQPQSQTPITQTMPKERNVGDEEFSPRTLIIYYDPTVGKGPLLEAIKTNNTEILYEYNNFNAVAVCIPEGGDIHAAIAHFQKVEGVLSVNRDRIYHLD